MTDVNVEVKHESEREKKIRKRFVVVFGAVGLVWVGLAALVLLHSYTFFESVVVCLLVMILSAVATLRSDFELWSGMLRDDNGAKRTEPDVLDKIRSNVRVIFYGIAFTMAFVKLVITLW
jgi:hypothetical protein